jgi:HAD superfamily hydrolase (TIGR01509 family)
MTSAVIFDCDGVLVDSEPLVNRIEAAWLSRWGWYLSGQEVRSLFKGRTFAEIATMIEANVPRPLPGDWIYELAMETALGFRRHLREVPGVRSVVASARNCGLPICVASQSALPRVQLSLEVCGLDLLFGTHVYTASMVARPKPAPDLFLHAAGMLGVEPSVCTVIEDSPSGVHAAVAAGMTVLGYAADEDGDALRAAGAVTFRHMSELPALLGLL